MTIDISPAPARSSSRDLHRGGDVALTVAAVLGGLSLVTALVSRSLA